MPSPQVVHPAGKQPPSLVSVALGMHLPAGSQRPAFSAVPHFRPSPHTSPPPQ